MGELILQVQQQLGETRLEVDLRLPVAGICAIFGRSGAGKTSLINVISGLSTPQQGEIHIAGRTLFSSTQGINLPIEQRKIGYVFQDARLFPHYTVRGNLNYGVSRPDAAYFASVTNLLALQPLLDRYPRDLSGGEKQRVALGRALLSKPDLLLMDEPLAALDMPRKKEVMPFLENLAQHFQLPILYVSHSTQEILRLADHLVVLEQGKVLSAGPIEQVWSSKAMRPWQSFSEQSTLFAATVTQQHPQYGLSQVCLAEGVELWVQQIEAQRGNRVRMQVRANDVSIALQKPIASSIRNILPAQIVAIEHQAPSKKSVSLKLELAAGCYLWAVVTEWAYAELALDVGMPVFAQIKGVSVSQRDVVLTH
ncbi:molybdenum ABC transporter ATP-binding protein ModC (plasmid) [Vibrio sp. HDW18]|uniref:molybdenum ABC transporter ATP-binding protein ModC n=1 Tax=Vibrio sp. HDW18 TaxID=2714948 RepID=UPI00140D432C|nr:molybdenum ABC transporter ATP-binding protein ModC [Vibrio sp. HDW18]QIL86876.1 molybdenum ABC transporter ATP-binding protein ModC [Vibrio sp. HDW18]